MRRRRRRRRKRRKRTDPKRNVVHTQKGEGRKERTNREIGEP
jgi:hypothetical protein